MSGLKINNSDMLWWATLFADTLLAMLCMFACHAWVSNADSEATHGTILPMVGAVALCSILLGICLPDNYTRPGARTDQILEHSARKSLLMLMSMCTLLAMTDTALLQRTLLVTFCIILFLSSALVGYIGIRLLAKQGIVPDTTDIRPLRDDMPLENIGNQCIKRCIDILLSLSLLLTIYPIVYIITCIAIKIKNPGPVYQTQKRYDINGRKFYCYQFRLGSIKNLAGIQNMPQIICVLKGEMSFVGSRPHTQTYNRMYRSVAEQEPAHHCIKPGMTGWAQTNGMNHESQDTEAIEACIKHNTWYMQNWNPWLDLYIILKTIINYKS